MTQKHAQATLAIGDRRNSFQVAASALAIWAGGGAPPGPGLRASTVTHS